MPTPSLLIVPARFKTGKLYSQIPTSGAGDFTVTRNTAATRLNSAGLLESVASGIPRLDYYTSGGVTGCPALLVEPAATNLALHSRDLTNAVWVKTNVTAVKNAVGADGVASGATTLTATAASGTVLQAIVNISQSRVFSAYVRRVTGTGAVEMTTNGGTNWTAVTISSTYTQVACAAQTVLNGSVGFRMAVSGDVIEVDFTQGEVGPVATSVIPTTTGTGSRSLDLIQVTGAVSGSIGQTEGVLYIECESNDGLDDVFFINRSVTNGIALYKTATNAYIGRIHHSPNPPITFQSASGVTGMVKIAIAYKSGDSTMYLNGSRVGTLNTNAITFGAALNSLGVNKDPFFSGAKPSRIRAVALYNTRLLDAELASLTAP